MFTLMLIHAPPRGLALLFALCAVACTMCIQPLQPGYRQSIIAAQPLDSTSLDVDQGGRNAFLNLPGGENTLHMRGSNNDTVWSESTTVQHIWVIPPNWEATWLALSLLSGLVLFAVGGVRLRKRVMQQRSRELEALVEKRTQEIEQRYQVAEGLRDVILRLNQNHPLEDSLAYIAGQVNAMLQAEWVGLIEASGSAPAHLVAACPETEPDQSPADLLQNCACLLLKARTALQVPTADLVRENELAQRSWQHAIIHPILLDGNLYGGLVALLGPCGHMTRNEQELLNTFCEQASLAIGNDRLRVQAAELAVVSERNRLARDLHDAVTQTLFSASLIAETLPALLHDQPHEGLSLLQELRQLTRGALAEMRTLLVELRPAVMADARLSDLLRQLVDAVTGKKGITVQFYAAEVAPLPEDVHICFYRIAQEALANVVKHSRAKCIAVNFTEQSARATLDGAGAEPRHRVVLEIRDDGRGFDLSHIPVDHFGLINMRERAQTAGVQFEVITQPGAGTLVRAAWERTEG